MFYNNIFFIFSFFIFLFGEILSLCPNWFVTIQLLVWEHNRNSAAVVCLINGDNHGNTVTFNKSHQLTINQKNSRAPNSYKRLHFFGFVMRQIFNSKCVISYFDQLKWYTSFIGANTELRKPAITASGAWGTFWLTGEHFRPKHMRFWCIFIFLRNHTLFLKDHQSYLQNRKCLECEKFVIQINNFNTCVAFFNVFKKFYHQFMLGERWGTFLNSVPICKMVVSII